MELNGQVRADAEGLNAHLVAREHASLPRREAHVAVELQPRPFLDQARIERLHGGPADLHPWRALNPAAERGGQRLGAEADTEDWDTRGVGRPNPVQLGADPVADSILIHRPDRAEDDHMVDAVERRQRAVLRELVHAHLGAPRRERVSDKAGVVDCVMADHDHPHPDSFGGGLLSVPLSGNGAGRARSGPAPWPSQLRRAERPRTTWLRFGCASISSGAPATP